ncbi:1-aminocyclopropane-1-carboxylate deaminase/D-cysteine desulfhydrase [Dyadobacter sp. CY312]|uniref:1-aminocyclopropane-1-carboxylate deaminase/D-cysteine desulfhydrase n=1 Tax=Dyadobacter sp. CY312 TaxID=2907303 RepID=UPI001F486B35|nr:pyridoxal-phosphate dependent enzyme [Dyadobacter sp. CY312]MCE7040806.1 pyridoxal-phosphate dependent enzyme [Dyadobacter sp. CY312]
MDKLVPFLPTPLQLLSDDEIRRAGIRLYIKRDDLIHPTVSGNKWRKLKYNLADAIAGNHATLLTFGGAYSNHLYATAAAGNALGFKTIGIVRGEDFESELTPTLLFCREQNMDLHFISRQEYKRRNEAEYLNEISKKFKMPYLIPEGGTTGLALNGVGEMATETQSQLGFRPAYYATAAGTGGTAAGILSTGSNVLAFSALKGGGFLADDISELLATSENPGNLQLLTQYHFGGYAKWTPELLSFMADFYARHGIQLEQVYTAKMMYGLYDLMAKDFFKPGDTVVAVHTGGLQGLLVQKMTDNQSGT